MTAELTLVQLSDAHFGADWELGHEPRESFRAAVEHALGHQPDAVVVTGDLTDAAEPSDYDAIRDELAPFECPVFVLPGNHDDREAMRTAFGLAGEGSDPIQYTENVGPLRLICADTLLPGRDGGDLDADRLEWIAGALADAKNTPVLIALHHPPFLSGISPMDGMAPPEPARREFGRLVEDHGAVVSIVAGHVHRPIASAIGSAPLFVAPSTYGQLRLDLADERLSFDPGERPGYGLHLIVDGNVVSHTVTLPS